MLHRKGTIRQLTCVKSHHMHTLLAKSQPISTSVPPEHVNRPQAVILHARPCWGAGSANPSVEDDQWSTESRRSKEDWPRGILLGWCTAFSLLIRYRNEPKPGNKWITHRRTKGKYKRRPLHTPLRIHDVYQKFLSHRGGPKSAGPSYYNKKKTTFQGKGEVKVSPGPPTGEGPIHATNACTSAGGKMAGGRAFMPDTKTYAYLYLVVPQLRNLLHGLPWKQEHTSCSA